MNENDFSASETWKLARKIAQLAYIHDRQTSKDGPGTIDENLGKTLRKVATVLSAHFKDWEKCQAPLFHVFAANALTKLYTDICKGTIAPHDARIACWRILTPPDSPDYNDEELASDLHLPTKEEIASAGGPKEAAISRLEDISEISKRSVYNYQKAMKSGDLKFSLAGMPLPYIERDKFAESVLKHIVELASDSHSLELASEKSQDQTRIQS